MGWLLRSQCWLIACVLFFELVLPSVRGSDDGVLLILHTGTNSLLSPQFSSDALLGTRSSPTSAPITEAPIVEKVSHLLPPSHPPDQTSTKSERSVASSPVAEPQPPTTQEASTLPETTHATPPSTSILSPPPTSETTTATSPSSSNSVAPPSPRQTTDATSPSTSTYAPPSMPQTSNSTSPSASVSLSPPPTPQQATNASSPSPSNLALPPLPQNTNATSPSVTVSLPPPPLSPQQQATNVSSPSPSKFAAPPLPQTTNATSPSASVSSAAPATPEQATNVSSPSPSNFAASPLPQTTNATTPSVSISLSPPQLQATNISSPSPSNFTAPPLPQTTNATSPLAPVSSTTPPTPEQATNVSSPSPSNFAAPPLPQNTNASSNGTMLSGPAMPPRFSTSPVVRGKNDIVPTTAPTQAFPPVHNSPVTGLVPVLSPKSHEFTISPTTTPAPVVFHSQSPKGLELPGPVSEPPVSDHRSGDNRNTSSSPSSDQGHLHPPVSSPSGSLHGAPEAPLLSPTKTVPWSMQQSNHSLPPLPPSNSLSPSPTSMPHPNWSLPPSSAPVHQPKLPLPPSPAPAHQPKLPLSPSPAPVHQPKLSLPPSPAPVHQPRLSLPPSPAPIHKPKHSLSPSPAPIHKPKHSLSPSPAPIHKPKHSLSPSPALVPRPQHMLPPPPPNLDCTSSTCMDPLTNSPPGSPCGCVRPIKVGLRLSVALYTFFPLVAELAKEIASGTFMKQSQVRIMGANAATEQPDKSIVLVDLVPLGEKFDATTAYLTSEKFWHKQVGIKASYFGEYDILYVTYPGLPPSPPMSPGNFDMDGGSNENNSRRIHPFGVDVRKRKERLGGSLIAIIVLSSVIALVLSVGVVWFLFLKLKDGDHLSGPTPRTPLPLFAKGSGGGPTAFGSCPSSASGSFSSSMATYTGSAKTFTAAEIERATSNFDDSKIIGEGGFGRVYQGILDDETKVAVKVLKRDDQQGSREFLAEVEMLSRLHHRNLVKLIGICTEEHFRCLVYELIPNGSVESHLHGTDKEIAPLEWAARMKIALGSARGLAYLHEDSSPRVIHRDFKSSNILLECDFTPKVSDFGLARTALDEGNGHISTRVMGTFGYVAPEYAMTGHLLVKSDVYSYGVVLLEILTGRKPVDMLRPPGQENLVTWARPLLTSREGLDTIIDPALGSSVPFDSMAKVAAIASMCVQPEVSHRPFMGEVVQALKLVCNENNEHRASESFSQGETTDQDPEIRISSGLVPEADKVLSASEIFSTSAKDASGSFRRHSNSGPLSSSSRSGQFWQRLRGFPRGSTSDHGPALKSRSGGRRWP